MSPCHLKEGNKSDYLAEKLNQWNRLQILFNPLRTIFWRKIWLISKYMKVKHNQKRSLITDRKKGKFEDEFGCVFLHSHRKRQQLKWEREKGARTHHGKKYLVHGSFAFCCYVQQSENSNSLKHPRCLLYKYWCSSVMYSNFATHVNTLLLY